MMKAFNAFSKCLQRMSTRKMISVTVSDLNTPYRVSLCVWSTLPTRLTRSRISSIQCLEADLTLSRINEICVDLGYNPAAVPKSVDRIHRVRCPANNNSNVPIHFIFVTGPDSFQNEEPSSFPGMTIAIRFGYVIDT